MLNPSGEGFARIVGADSNQRNPGVSHEHFVQGCLLPCLSLSLEILEQPSQNSLPLDCKREFIFLYFHIVTNTQIH